MSMLRNVLTYMGLGPDEDYDDGYLYDAKDREIDLVDRGAIGDLTGHDLGDDDPHAQRDRPGWLNLTDERDPEPEPEPASQLESPRKRISIDDEEPEEPARPQRSRKTATSARSSRPLRAVPPAAEANETDDGVRIRSIPPMPDQAHISSNGGEGPRYVKPHSIAPESFSDAKTIADEFKNDVPVIMNLRGVERDLARRLIDFASGICYALDGGMEKLASQVFLLTPQDVEVSDEDRRRIEQRGYDR